MSRLAVPLAFLAAGCTPAADDPPPGPPPPWTPEVQAAADGVNRFTFDLYAKLREKPGSTVVSPFSVATAFAMLADGANGATRDELVKTLHLPADVAATGDLGRFYAAGGKPYELRVANALWGQTGYPWRPEFVARQRERFGAVLTDHDFGTDAEGGRTAVNRWVERRTADRIKDLFPAGSLGGSTRLVLANAVYFKGKWQDEFKPAATWDQPFTRADGTTAPVPLMYRVGRYKHARLDSFQVLELPYQGGELAMAVILPTAPAGLPAIESKLTADTARDWLAKLTPTPDVRLFLPRFKAEAGFDLPATLQAMGVKLAFDPRQADLLGLVTARPEGNLFVGAAVHKAFAEVNEQGTEAAAATGIGVKTASARMDPPEPVVFRADRPFLFLIRDVSHGTVLFVGRYAGPGGGAP